jgi:hypothetical protein
MVVKGVTDRNHPFLQQTSGEIFKDDVTGFSFIWEIWIHGYCEKAENNFVLCHLPHY